MNFFQEVAAAIQRRQTAVRDTYGRPVHQAINCGTVSVLALEQNPQRANALFVNDSGSTIYLSLGYPAVLNTGIRVSSNGGFFEINALNMWRGQVYAITSIASQLLLVTEMT